MPRTSTDNDEPAATSVTEKATKAIRTVVDRSQKSPEVGLSESHFDHKTPKANVNPAGVDVISPFQQLADDLMDAVDNVCSTDQIGLQMHETPCEFRQSEEEIMAELFNDSVIDEVNETSDLSQSLYEIADDVDVRKYSQHELRQTLLQSIPSSKAVLGRHKLSFLKRDSILKRSFSFPKDLEHVRDRSAKFCRALSGDRIVPQSLSYERNENIFHAGPSKLAQSTQPLSSQISLQTAGTVASYFTNVSRGKKEADIDLSVSSIPNSHSFNKRPFSKAQQSFSQTDAETLQLNCKNDFEETFDVISKFVDNCIDNEIIDDIDGHLSCCHIQSQVMDSSVDKNNNTEILMDKVDHVNSDIERHSAFKATEGILADSDEWFDEAVADIENWFS